MKKLFLILITSPLRRCKRLCVVLRKTLLENLHTIAIKRDHPRQFTRYNLLRSGFLKAVTTMAVVIYYNDSDFQPFVGIAQSSDV